METTIELEATITIGGVVRTVTAEVEVDGEYRPASWGYSGGSPEEWPDATLVSASYTDDDGAKVVLAIDAIDEADAREIESRAITKAVDDEADWGEDPFSDD